MVSSYPKNTLDFYILKLLDFLCLSKQLKIVTCDLYSFQAYRCSEMSRQLGKHAFYPTVATILENLKQTVRTYTADQVPLL